MELIFGWLKQQSTAILSIVLIFICLTIPSRAIANESVMRTLTVTGEGKEMIPTTLTQVELGVEVQGKTASDVQQELAAKSRSVIDFLRSRQVQKLKTTGISLQPNYNYDSKPRELIGYFGTNRVSFRLETEKIGNLLDEAVKIGASRIDRLSFTATDSAIATAQNQALQAAVQNAQSQAQSVLNSLNFTPQDTVKIQINGANIPQPMSSFEMAAVAKDARVNTPVVGGEQTVRASVTLVIQY